MNENEEEDVKEADSQQEQQQHKKETQNEGGWLLLYCSYSHIQCRWLCCCSFFIIFAADVLLAVLYIGAFGYDKQDTATTTTTPIMCIEKNLKLLNMKDRES